MAVSLPGVVRGGPSGGVGFFFLAMGYWLLAIGYWQSKLIKEVTNHNDWEESAKNA
jgi:hypothetical protein